jgi:serine/threonine protein phosphatase PrpC
MAEIINSRDYQEDRTTAKASVEEEAKRIKDRALSGAPPNSSFHLDVRQYLSVQMRASSSTCMNCMQYLEKCRTEDFAFFGIYDGHEGSYVSDYLHQHLHMRFRQRLAVNGSADKGVAASFLEVSYWLAAMVSSYHLCFSFK